MNRQSERLNADSFRSNSVSENSGLSNFAFRSRQIGRWVLGRPNYPQGRATLAQRALNAVHAIVKAPIRFPALYALDVLTTFICLAVASAMRLGIYAIDANFETYKSTMMAWPIEAIVCALVFPATGLYSRNWRYASVSDVLHIVRAVVVATLVFVCAIFLLNRLEQIPRSVIAINALLLTGGLAASRLTFRLDEMLADARSRRHAMAENGTLIPVLLVGAGSAADLYLRALQRDPNSTHWPVGFVDTKGDQVGLLVRGVPILGTVEDLEKVLEDLDAVGDRPRHIIFTEAPAAYGQEMADNMVQIAERLGIAVSRLAAPTELRSSAQGDRFELKPIELTDLLERPQITHDAVRVRRLVRGTRVLVTGAGGSIGSELVRQIAAFEPAELVLIDNCEYNLYAIDMELGEKFPSVPRVAYLCNVREAGRVNGIFAAHQPELIYHAAALKHVPLVELNPCEGTLTNVIGTMNVAEAAKSVGARAMVQVSTDKVVNPASVMGATKRLAELYCQALELDASEVEPSVSRFMTVRFGNVLGSSGSLIPLFKRQLAAGGPLTVTDPEMKRFFMTIREAVELTLQASAYGLERAAGRGEIFVLDMGKPVKIIDIARRVISLAGYEPDKDIKIEVVGCRPGEKLFEELFDDSEKRVSSPVPGVLGAVPNPVPLPVLREAFTTLRGAAETGDTDTLFKTLSDIIPVYRRQAMPARSRPPVELAPAALEQRS